MFVAGLFVLLLAVCLCLLISFIVLCMFDLF